MVDGRMVEEEVRQLAALMGPAVAEAMEQVHRVMGHHAHLPSFGKCFVYELWVRQVEFEVVHPEPMDMFSTTLRFQLLFPSGLLMELIDALEPDDMHRDQLRKCMAQHQVSQGVLLCIQVAAPSRAHAVYML
jgi:hypothetical protein